MVKIEIPLIILATESNVFYEITTFANAVLSNLIKLV